MTPTREILDLDEADIVAKMLTLEDRTVLAITRVMQALMERDIGTAQALIEADVDINALHDNIEQECLATIATQQPVARDLRAIIADLHIAQELERIADHATAIARIILRMDGDTDTEIPVSLLNMSESACAMLGKAMRAYRQQAMDLARELAEDDDALDLMQEALTTELVALMTDRRLAVTTGSCLLWIVHNLERIGDLATNIAERVLYIGTGATLDLNSVS